MPYKIQGDTDGIEINIGEGTSRDNISIYTYGTGNVLNIGKNCRISCHIFLSQGASLTIGSGVISTNIVQFHLHEGSQVAVGDSCLISHNVVFRPSDAHKIFDIASGERINPPRPIVIGAKVWIGEGVSVLKGAIVPDNCVVGINSLLTSAFEEPNCVIAGSPARVIRKGIRWAP